MRAREHVVHGSEDSNGGYGRCPSRSTDAACTRAVLTTTRLQHAFDQHLDTTVITKTCSIGVRQPYVERGPTCGLASGHKRRTSTKPGGGIVLVQGVEGPRNLEMTHEALEASEVGAQFQGQGDLDDARQLQVEAAEDRCVDCGDDAEEAHERAPRLRSTIRCNTTINSCIRCFFVIATCSALVLEGIASRRQRADERLHGDSQQIRCRFVATFRSLKPRGWEATEPKGGTCNLQSFMDKAKWMHNNRTIRKTLTHYVHP